MKNKFGKAFLWGFVFWWMVGSAFGQVFSITQDQIMTCTGSVMDDGLDASSSSPDLDEVAVICGESSPLHLDFVQFQLGLGDFLEIYDGTDVSAPLFGSYGSNDLFNQVISSSNVSGCLTLRFVTNAFSHGDFTAEISCGTLCNNPLPASFAVDTTAGCMPLEVVLTSDMTDFQEVLQMVWHFDDGQQTTSMGSVRHVYEIDGVFNPWLEITDREGCVYTDTLDIPIRVKPLPTSIFEVTPSETTLPNTTFTLIPSSLDAVELHWDFDGFGSFVSLGDTTYSFPEDKVDTYDISLIATNEFGCTDTALRTVEVKDDLNVYFPNAFTPDGDNVNDAWYVQGRGFVFNAFSAEIFDRWGDLVYQSKDPLQAWTGAKLGSTYFVPDGMYFYRVYIQDNVNNVNHLYTGHIQLLR